MSKIDRRLCVAPMMAHTDRHFRYLLRLISARTMLYTEMITTGALIHGDAAPRLAHSSREHPLGIQVGGSDPRELAQCARLAANAGYDEINLNIGCPSERVSTGRFGACLMREPALVGTCVRAMRDAVDLPVTVKTRIGVDDHDDYDHLAAFVHTVSEQGCDTFIIHGRKAWLSGLSPRQNRSVPPLRHDVVYRLKRDFPRLEIIINGGIATLDDAAAHLEHVDGAMIGRAVCQNPYLLAQADALIFGAASDAPPRGEILRGFMRYAKLQLRDGVSLHNLTRHLLGLFQGQPGARAWRRHLSEAGPRRGAGIEVIEGAAQLVRAA